MGIIAKNCFEGLSSIMGIMYQALCKNTHPDPCISPPLGGHEWPGPQLGIGSPYGSGTLGHGSSWALVNPLELLVLL